VITLPGLLVLLLTFCLLWRQLVQLNATRMRFLRDACSLADCEEEEVPLRTSMIYRRGVN
jgi:hypothetical protein